MLKRLFFLFLLGAIYLNSYSQTAIAPKREFRGVWVATVANIDWPSKPGLPVDLQKKELTDILDKHERAGINAILLQIRPTADAFYARGRELWSRYLTGKQGVKPSPFYDPLDFAIAEAHKRGMELHAWFNPYRATKDLVVTNTSIDHITRQKPEWFFTYGREKLFNPGIPEVRDYIVQVILDVVRNYDIDGVHFDDYFYPYPEAAPLPDAATFKKYGAGFANVGDWRRNNVDQLIHTLSDSIHKAKTYMKFGISPFAIWRNASPSVPDGSDSHGFEGYTQLYGDARNWAKNNWVDYMNPQLYFAFNFYRAPFEKLLDWWAANNYGRHVYVGQAVYRSMEKTEGWRDRTQLPEQMRYLRKNPNVQGSVFFSSKSLTNNMAGFRDSLQNNFYKYKSLPPLMPWLDTVPPQPPLLLRATRLANKAVELHWIEPKVANDGEPVFGYVIYKFNDGEAIDLNNPKNILEITFDKTVTSFTDTSPVGTATIYVVTALDHTKNESLPSNQVIP